MLPTRGWRHPALAFGFSVLSFGDLGEPDIAYVEHALDAVNLEEDEGVSPATLTLNQLRSPRAVPAASRDLIERSATQNTGGVHAHRRPRLAHQQFQRRYGDSCAEVVATRDTTVNRHRPTIIDPHDLTAEVYRGRGPEANGPRRRRAIRPPATGRTPVAGLPLDAHPRR